MFHGRCALAVMAKAPKAGHVKTRLSPPLDSHQAAALNIAFLRDTIACLKEVEAAAAANAVILLAVTLLIIVALNRIVDIRKEL